MDNYVLKRLPSLRFLDWKVWLRLSRETYNPTEKAIGGKQDSNMTKKHIWIQT